MKELRMIRLAREGHEHRDPGADPLTTQLASEGYRRLGLIASVVAGTTLVSLGIAFLTFLVGGSTATRWGLVSDLVLLFCNAFVAFACRRSLFSARAYPAVALSTEFLVSVVLGSSLMGWQTRVGESMAAAIEAKAAFPFDLGAGEVPWTGLWILLFAAVVPLRPRQHLFGAAASVATLIVWPIVSIVATGVPAHLEPFRARMTLIVVEWVFLRGLLAAGMAYFVARSVFGLRQELAAAQNIGSYRLREKLGEGGMGEVWRADHQMLARSAAIKLIKPDRKDGQRASDDSVRRFEREVQAAAQLRSPHTIEIYDYGVTQDGRLYYVMELLDGLDLEKLVRRHGALPWRRAVHVLEQTCHSLAEAHERGLIHRDIKPANISVCRMGRDVDQVKVLDFGLVKASRSLAGDPVLTQEGTFVGTPAYSAPELATRGLDHADSRSDLYSLGCVAHWLLTGRLPFEAGTPIEMLVLHSREAPRAPSACTASEIPLELDEIVLDCLAKNPDQRPRSAEQLAERLRNLVARGAWSRAEAVAWWSLHRPVIDPSLG